MKKYFLKYTLGFLAVFFWTATGLIRPSIGEENNSMAQENLNSEDTYRNGQYLGAPSCASSNCHGSVRPRNVYDVRQNEYFIWLKRDRHKQAFDVLYDPLSKRIARNMKLDRLAPESPFCLACHSIDIPKALQAKPFDPGEGITCEGCHGPAGGWIAGHTEDQWTYEDSINAGMTDLKDPVTRAKRCLDCHLGNERFEVNHELIASGHPSLLFELVSFSAVMPSHWREDPEVPPSLYLVTGQTVAFQEEMHRLARRTRSPDWPEFSEMVCRDCHHSLKTGKDRQIRGYSGKAGLPNWRPVNYVPLRPVISVFHPEGQEDFENLAMKLSKQIARLRTPPEAVFDTAVRLADQTETIIASIERSKADESLSNVLIHKMVNDPFITKNPDIDSLRQAVMWLNALVASNSQNMTDKQKAEITRIIDALYDGVSDLEAFDPKFISDQMDLLNQAVGGEAKQVSIQKLESGGDTGPAEKPSPKTELTTLLKGPIYTIQVGVFQNKDNAERLRDHLSKNYDKVVMIPLQAGKTEMFRVWVGSFSSEEEADRVVQDLKKKEGLPTLIMRK